ncbi:hypothetical protein [Kutzneria sp. CA-103260]|uniref:hypothetical protein n=1 Tax=Kutzneria sp. CA-103260 TaxID=2802641 RepID=UPI001BA849A1|nr:hypothetical protein [Kutzneria sp. CA-103260]QUQ70331.1 hypothetical protein JJ691_81060 [Kutzneria sp. CA-103260]
MSDNDIIGSAPTVPVERILVDHDATKRLGNWTSAGIFEIKARAAQVVVDLRSPDIPDSVEVRLDMQRSMVKLLVPEDATIDQWGLDWEGRGKVKDSQAPTGPTSRVIRLVGASRNSEVRVRRGGLAIVAAMVSRDYIDDVRRAHKEGRLPTVDDPTRDPYGKVS